MKLNFPSSGGLWWRQFSCHMAARDAQCTKRSKGAPPLQRGLHCRHLRGHPPLEDDRLPLAAQGQGKNKEALEAREDPEQAHTGGKGLRHDQGSGAPAGGRAAFSGGPEETLELGRVDFSLSDHPYGFNHCLACLHMDKRWLNHFPSTVPWARVRMWFVTCNMRLFKSTQTMIPFFSLGAARLFGFFLLLKTCMTWLCLKV